MPTAKIIYLYKFNELSEEAKERALNDIRQWPDLYAWADDNLETLKEFEKQFPIKSKDFEYGGWRGPWINSQTNIDDDINDLRGVRLMKYIINNYYDDLYEPKYIGRLESRTKFVSVYSKIQKEWATPTGYCLDHDIRQPLYKFLANPDKYQSFEDILRDCLEEWVQACNRDFEYCYTDEYLIDFVTSNDYDFLETGEIA